MLNPDIHLICFLFFVVFTGKVTEAYHSASGTDEDDSYISADDDSVNSTFIPRIRGCSAIVQRRVYDCKPRAKTARYVRSGTAVVTPRFNGLSVKERPPTPEAFFRPRTPTLPLRTHTRVMTRGKGSKIPLPGVRMRPSRVPANNGRRYKKSERMVPDYVSLDDPELLRGELRKYYARLMACEPGPTSGRRRHLSLGASRHGQHGSRGGKYKSLERLGDPPDMYESAGDSAAVYGEGENHMSIEDLVGACKAQNIPFQPEDVLNPDELEVFRQYEEIHMNRLESHTDSESDAWEPQQMKPLYDADECLDRLYNDLYSAVSLASFPLESY